MGLVLPYRLFILQPQRTDKLVGNYSLYSSGGSHLDEYDAFELDLSLYPLLKADETPPVLSLLGQQEIFLHIGDEWIEPGVIAIDPEDGDLSSSVTIKGLVNTSVSGSYRIEYKVSDNSQNFAEPVYRWVYVEENEEVEILNVEFTIEATSNGVKLSWTNEDLPAVPHLGIKKVIYTARISRMTRSSWIMKAMVVGSKSLNFDLTSFHLRQFCLDF